MIRLATFLLCFSFICTASYSQARFPAIDKSPMDMSYFPANYPIYKIQNTNQNKPVDPLLVRVIYSRPQKNGRVVFGELVEFGKIWRLGANEATEIELFKDAKIGANKLKKGKYTLYAIPVADKWTIIFNKETDIWGAFQYDTKKDVLRVDVKTEKIAEASEAFTIVFEKINGSNTATNMVIAWDDVAARLPLTF